MKAKSFLINLLLSINFEKLNYQNNSESQLSEHSTVIGRSFAL